MLSLLLATSFSSASAAAAPPGLASMVLLPAPVLAQDPWHRPWAHVSGWSHGPDGPDDVPEDGYGFKASNTDNKGWLWAGMGALAVGGLTAASARNQTFTMRDAQTLSELDAAYEKQRKLAYTSYGFLGAGALCMVLEIPF